VQIAEALAVLGISPGVDGDDVRQAYLRLIRDRHPDRAGNGPEATRQAARITEAYAVLRRAAADHADELLAPAAAAPMPAPTPAPEPLEVRADEDSLTLGAPADEAFAALFEAAGRVGHIAYFDRRLGILETVVRFEGGPSCSVLITLQGRADGTEAFCTMESMEAAATPPIAPVVDALVTELSR
jgi:DnaJ domain